MREKAKQLVTLLKDEEKLREERIHALKTKEKMAQTTSGKMAQLDTNKPLLNEGIVSLLPICLRCSLLGPLSAQPWGQRVRGLSFWRS